MLLVFLFLVFLCHTNVHKTHSLSIFTTFFSLIRKRLRPVFWDVCVVFSCVCVCFASSLLYVPVDTWQHEGMKLNTLGQDV